MRGIPIFTAVTNKKTLTLCNEIFLKLEQEFKIEKVVWRQSFFTDDGLHRLHVFADSVACVLYVSR